MKFTDISSMWGSLRLAPNTEARLFFPQPTMPVVHIWDSQQFGCVCSFIYRFLIPHTPEIFTVCIFHGYGFCVNFRILNFTDNFLVKNFCVLNFTQKIADQWRFLCLTTGFLFLLAPVLAFFSTTAKGL